MLRRKHYSVILSAAKDLGRRIRRSFAVFAAQDDVAYKGILLVSAALYAAACAPHTTQATQVGVKFNKITRSTEIAQAGATYFFAPFINDWATFDTSTQNLVMSAKIVEGDRKEKDD